MSIENNTNEQIGETLTQQSDPGVAALGEALRVSIREQLIAAARASGVIGSPQAHAQADMLAQIATRSVMSLMAVMRVRTTETAEKIAAFEAHEAYAGVENAYLNHEVAPTIAESIVGALIQNGMIRLDRIEGGGAVTYIGTLFALPPEPVAPAAPAPAPSRIIIPGQGGL